MSELKFKILVHRGQPIVIGLLSQGLYGASNPVFNPLSRTLQDMEMMVRHSFGANEELLNRALENFRKCELKTFELKQID